MDAEDRSNMCIELNNLAFALEMYHAAKGSYPQKLEELVPQYIAAVPKDIFNNDADLSYKR